MRKERLARASSVNLSAINRRIKLFERYCPEAIELRQDKQFTPDVTRILRNMIKLRANEAVKSHIGRYGPEILTHLELVVNTVSMEEAVQQQQEAEA